MNYIDFHADTLTEIVSGNLMQNTNDIDLKRIQNQFKHYTQVFAIWKDMRLVDKAHVEEDFWQTYQTARNLLLESESVIRLCSTFPEMEQAWEEGKQGAFLSIEDLSFMGSYAAQIRELGFRFAMLTWNSENAYGCGAAKNNKSGLTEYGKQMVRQLEGQKIILDISHLSDAGIDDILSLTTSPVIASHSNVRDISCQPRNLCRAHIQELIDRHGILGLNLYRPFVGEALVTYRDLFSHIDYILELGGEDILAFGCDFDGCSGCFPEKITGVESMSLIQGEMEKAGFDHRIIQKIFSENAFRFLKNNL